MAKPLVIDAGENARVPFLRGILTRSLQDLGLSFEQAYGIASRVRDELGSLEEITSDELRERVRPHLEPFGDDVIQRYRTLGAAETILIRFPEGVATPFSRGRQRVELERCGLSVDQASEVVGRIHLELLRAGTSEIAAGDLKLSVHRHLQEELGEGAARSYLLWEAFYRSNRPLILLIGGTAGCGKSTIATGVAHLLDIVRTESTDMLREVMRAILPRRLLPALHTSSFKAWEVLPVQERAGADSEALLIDGYLAQMELLSQACEAVIQRALQERVSLIVEGVHVHPALVDRIDAGDAIVVPITLGVLKASELRRRIRGRGSEVRQRRSRRYLDNFDAIWRLQSFLLSEADRTGAAIVPNDEKDRTLQLVTRILIDELAKHFEGATEAVLT